MTTPTLANETLHNASANTLNGFADMTGLAGPIVVVLYIVCAMLAVQVLAPWVASSRLVERAGQRVVHAFQYAIKGVAASAVLLIAAAPVYFVATADGETKGLALEAVAMAVAGFLGLVVVGWLADRAVAAWLNAHPEYDEWADLFPEEESEEAVATDGGDVDE